MCWHPQRAPFRSFHVGDYLVLLIMHSISCRAYLVLSTFLFNVLGLPCVFDALGMTLAVCPESTVGEVLPDQIPAMDACYACLLFYFELYAFCCSLLGGCHYASLALMGHCEGGDFSGSTRP